MSCQEIAVGDPLFQYKGFAVRVGYMVDRNDLPHYLVLNEATEVIEHSTSRLVEARAVCVVLGQQLELQDKAIAVESIFSDIETEEKEKADVLRRWN